MGIVLRLPRSSIPARRLLVAIVVLAALLRLVFFVGLVSGDPQDDGIYYNNAFELYSQGPTYLERYSDLPADFLANPIDQFFFRPMVTYPIAAIFVLLGPGELQAVLWALFCSLLTVVVVYRLGATLHGATVGLLGSLLCAFYPLEVVGGTRILSDVQQGLFATLGLWLIVEGSQRHKLFLVALAGAAAGAAYLANGRGSLVLAMLLLAVVALWVRGRATWHAPLLLLGGFAVVFGIEAIVYGVTTSDPLLSYHIQSGASRFKYLHEPASSIHWGRLHIEYTNGRPFELLQTVFLGERPTRQAGWFFFVFAAAAIHGLARRRNRLLLVLAILTFLYLEFGPLFLSMDWANAELHYQMVFKQERFLHVLTGPLIVSAAFFIDSLRRRSRARAAALLLVLFVTSLTAIAHTRAYYRRGLLDLRAVTPHVMQLQNRPVYGDLWAVHHVRIFSGYRADNLRVLDQRTTPRDLDGACLLSGGSRGVELLADYVEASLPAFVRESMDAANVSSNWVPVASFAGPKNPFRRTDLTLYCTTPAGMEMPRE